MTAEELIKQLQDMKQYLVFNVGCIECGVSSKVVGVFTIKAMADNVAARYPQRKGWMVA